MGLGDQTSSVLTADFLAPVRLVRRWGLVLPPFGPMQWTAVPLMVLGAATLRRLR